MTFQDAWNELKTQVPKIDILLAQKLVQRAWRDIRDSRFWSFQTAETTIDVPDQISSGTVTVTNGSPTVVADVTADAAWAAVGTVALSTRQIRIGSGPIYNITAYATPNITLDRNYGEETAALVAYSVYKCYHAEPAANFLRWISVVDPINGYQLAVNRTKAEIDRRDPQRGSTGQPYLVASYKWDATNLAHLFELYPHPTSQRSYRALYQSTGAAFAAQTLLPVIIPDEVLMERAKYYAYEWAMANSAAHPDLRGVNWMALRQQSKADYEANLFKAKKQDEEIFPQNYTESYLTNRWSGSPNWWGSYNMNHAAPYGYWG